MVKAPFLSLFVSEEAVVKAPEVMFFSTLLRSEVTLSEHLVTETS